MKIIGVIPARYKSSRFPGKPLADICGKPMIWWVYSRVSKIKQFSAVYCAIDDERVREVCESESIPYIMTKDNHPEHISRIHEVSERIEADYYICINGDEPLISEDCILPVFPKKKVEEPYFGGAMRVLTDPSETIDFANIKLVTTDSGRCIYMSRSPVPYPKGLLHFEYKKYVGVECFNKAALQFFVNTPMGQVEKIEDIDHLRFIENGIPLWFSMVDSQSLSVDTPKDLEYVREVVKEKINKGKITI